MNLKGKVLLGVVPVIALSTMCLGYVTYAKLGNEREHEIVREMQLSKDQAALRVMSFLERFETKTALLSEAKEVQRPLTEGLAFSTKIPKVQAARTFIASFQRQFPEFLSVQIFQTSEKGGCVEPAMKLGEGSHPGISKLCEDLLESGESRVGAFLFDQQIESSFLVLGQTIENSSLAKGSPSEQSSPSDLLLVTIDTQHLDRDFSQLQVSSRGRLFFVDDLGQQLFTIDKSQIGKKIESADILLKQPPKQHFSHNMHDANHGMIMVPDFEGSKALAHTENLRFNLNFTGVLPHEVFKVAHQEIAPMVLAITLSAMFITSAILWILINRMILSPIGQLQIAAKSIGNGESIEQVSVIRKDEIGLLQASFYEMSEKLNASIAEITHSHQKIEQLAYVDSLTGLANRRCFLEKLDEVIERDNESNSQSQIAVFFIDVDDFKRINDLLGHECGDAFISQVGKRLSSTIDEISAEKDLSSSNIVSRFGGDEFVTFISNIRDEEEVNGIALALQQSLREPILVGKQQFRVNISIGMAIYPEHGRNGGEILKSADTAMYNIKLGNKNGYCLFCYDMANEVTEKAQLEYALRTAIDNNELHLVYQPQVCAYTNKTLGLEALLRWTHPEKGNIPPDVFIPIAEEFGLIGTIGHWVLNEACRQWNIWSDAGVAPSRIAVNVSQRQLSQADITDQVSSVVKKYEMPAHVLELEITESCIMEAPMQVVETIQNIRDLNVRIALDDFGTGYSSLASLASLPIDTIKLDRSFVTNVHTLSGNSSIVSAVLSMAQELNLETVAEGVETESEKYYLQEKKCDVLQGYLLSRPMDVDSAQEWLSQQSELGNHRKSA
ncbi:MAG: EAL domain-containing protein [Gammaproteobacteria bacterium]|nr:EAL domain-containing protein [Gammaproteobacteria bacterium]